MKWYHYALFILKLLFLIEFSLVLYDKKLVSPILYFSSEILFKLFLSIYIQYVSLFVIYNNISLEDKVCISFGGGLLMYDAIINDLPTLLELYGIPNTSLVR
jgi:hypothetical protein